METIEFGRGPSLHGSYPASSLLWPPPTPDRGRRRLWISRHPVARTHALGPVTAAGSLRFLVDLSTPAVPYHPGEPIRCIVLVASRPVSGFALIRKVDHSPLV